MILGNILKNVVVKRRYDNPLTCMWLKIVDLRPYARCIGLGIVDFTPYVIYMGLETVDFTPYVIYIGGRIDDL